MTQTTNTVYPATVLPQIRPTERPEGLLLQDSSQNGCRFGFLVVFTVLWNLVSWPIAIGFFLFTPFLRAAEAPRPVSWITNIFALIPIIFCGIGLVMIAWLLYRLFVRSQFAPAELIIPTWPLRLGETTNLTFRRRAIGFVQVERLEAELRCIESATYRVGTDNRTVRETIYTAPLPSFTMLPGMNTIEANWSIHVPQEGPPSFDTFSNSLIWSVVVTIHTTRVPIDASTFTLVVLPEVLP